MPDNHANSIWLRDATAITIGLTVPAMVSGRAVLQGLAAAALVGVLIIAWQDRGIFARAVAAARSRFGIAVVVAFAAMAVSIPGSLDPLRSFEAWARTFAYIGGCVLFWAFLATDPRAQRMATQTLVAGSAFGVAVVTLSMLGWTLPLQILKNEYILRHWKWGFLAPKAYAAALACAVPILIWLAVQFTGAWRWATVATVVVGAVTIVATGNKAALAGWLAMTLAVSLAVAMHRGGQRLWTWPIFAILVSGIILVGVANLPDVPTSTAVWPWIPTELVDSHRQQIWHFTMGKIAEAPWTGYGINSIDRVAGAHDIIPGYLVEKLPSHPHNWVLEILGETGVIGFVPVVFALAWLAYRHLMRFVANGETGHLAQLGLAATFWGSSLFNFSIWSSWWLIGYFLLTAIVAASSQTPVPARPASG
jgi:O-antigen ligase